MLLIYSLKCTFFEELKMSSMKLGSQPSNTVNGNVNILVNQAVLESN